MPQFPGGVPALYRYLKNHVQYPVSAKEMGYQGTVYLSFVVEKDGSISNVVILRSVGGGCDEEAIRVVKSMPDWSPGTQMGRPVRVIYNLPIKFTLQ
jgi:protein TonB